MVTPQQQIFERQRQRSNRFALDLANLNGLPPGADFFAKQRQFGLDNSEDTRAVADLNYQDDLKRWAPPTQSAQSPPLSPSATQTNETVQRPADTGQHPGDWVNPALQTKNYSNNYVEATLPVVQRPHRNNFNGAENAPDGSVVRGIDKLLYRRSGGQFVRVPPRGVDDFEPPTTIDQSLAVARGANTDRANISNAQTNALVARNRAGAYSTAGLNPDGSPRQQQFDDGARIGAINNQPTDATAAGRKNLASLNESLATSQSDFGLKQDEANDQRVRARQTSAGSYTDMNRRSPRFGSQINWFDPGSVNPDSLSQPRKKPVAAAY